MSPPVVSPSDDPRWALSTSPIRSDRWERRLAVGDLSCHLRCERVFKMKGRWGARVGRGKDVWMWELIRTAWSISAGSAVSLVQAMEDANRAFDAAEAAFRFSGRTPDYLDQD